MTTITSPIGMTHGERLKMSRSFIRLVSVYKIQGATDPATALRCTGPYRVRGWAVPVLPTEVALGATFLVLSTVERFVQKLLCLA